MVHACDYAKRPMPVILFQSLKRDRGGSCVSGRGDG